MRSVCKSSDLPRVHATAASDLLNDAKSAHGSRLDRHERAGQGQLGLETFRRILNDPRLRGVPMVVETPGPIEEWKTEIRLLRGLVAPAAARHRQRATA